MQPEELLAEIGKLPRQRQTLLIAIDGRGGSGKSTLAVKLQKSLPDVAVVHLDDFAYPMQNTDRQRLLEQVILPLERDEVAKYQRFDHVRKQLAEWQEIQPGGVVIVEGFLSLHEALYRHYDYKIWLECPAEIGYKQGLARDINQYKVDTTSDWLTNWLPFEQQMITEQQPQVKADICIDSTLWV